MKKTAIITAAIAVAVEAQAYDFPFLIFQTNSGETTTVSVESLTIKSVDGQLVATNADGNVSFALADMSKMFFAKDETTNIDNAENGTERMEVFTLDGIRIGSFESMDRVKERLKTGIYIVKTSKRTFKTAVK